MTTPFTVRTDDATVEQLRDLAVRERRSISFMAAELIREALDQRGQRRTAMLAVRASDVTAEDYDKMTNAEKLQHSQRVNAEKMREWLSTPRNLPAPDKSPKPRLYDEVMRDTLERWGTPMSGD